MPSGERRAGTRADRMRRPAPAERRAGPALRPRHAPRHALERGSLLLVTLWVLIGAAVMVFGAQAQDLARMRRARSRFEHAAAVWAARGAVHYSVGYLKAFSAQPSLALSPATPPAFPKAHANDAPVGWFLASTPYPAADADFGLRSEHARLPLSNLPPGAVTRLFGQSAPLFRQEVARRQALTASGGISVRLNVFAHPLELLAPPLNFDRGIYQGQDRNDNHLLDPQEVDLPATSPLQRTAKGVDRGMQDFLTTLTDGKFAAYDADDAVLGVFLADFPEMPPLFAQYRSDPDRPDPQAFLDVATLSSDRAQAWRTLCQRSLASVSTFFRHEAYGTVRGEPVTRVQVVTEALLKGKDADTGKLTFRIVDWRQDR